MGEHLQGTFQQNLGSAHYGGLPSLPVCVSNVREGLEQNGRGKRRTKRPERGREPGYARRKQTDWMSKPSGWKVLVRAFCGCFSTAAPWAWFGILAPKSSQTGKPELASPHPISFSILYTRAWVTGADLQKCVFAAVLEGVRGTCHMSSYEKTR